MIEIIPAIDLIEGKCVRLEQGCFRRKSIYGADPVDMARWFEDNGFRRLHLVDLDGAGEGKMRNLHIMEKIASATSLVIDYGGGLKTREDVASVFNAGAAMVCIGSMAVKNRGEFQKVLSGFDPVNLILASDVKDGHIAVAGWKEESGVALNDFIRQNIDSGISKVMCTGISRDGTLEGPDMELYSQVTRDFPELFVIAGGGVSSAADIERLDELSLSGVVVGKAFYENKIKMSDIKKYLH